MKRVITSFISKLLVSVLVTLIVLILIKSKPDFKESFYKYTYASNISFAKFNELYKKYLGNTTIFNSSEKTETVFSEKLTYKSISDYKDGAKLEIEDNYMIPIEKSGVVVFIGEKDGYNNTVIVQRIDGVDEWYGNMEKINVKLYDYVKEGSTLGIASKEMYIVYKKEGNIIDYKEYLK